MDWSDDAKSTEKWKKTRYIREKISHEKLRKTGKKRRKV